MPPGFVRQSRSPVLIIRFQTHEDLIIRISLPSTKIPKKKTTPHNYVKKPNIKYF